MRIKPWMQRLCLIVYSMTELQRCFSSYDPPLSNAQLSRRPGAAINHKYRISLPLVEAALLGQPVESTAQCPDTNHTYGDYLAMGHFLNIPAGVTADSADKGIVTDTPYRFVPRVSPLQLHIFAETFKTAKGTKVHHLFICLLWLFMSFSSGISICQDVSSHVRPCTNCYTPWLWEIPR